MSAIVVTILLNILLLFAVHLGFLAGREGWHIGLEINLTSKFFILSFVGLKTLLDFDRLFETSSLKLRYSITCLQKG